MGYRLKKLPSKKSDPQWKVQYVSYKKSDIENFDQTNPRKTWDVGKDRWKPLGFYKYMTFEEAKVRAKQLNAQKQHKAQEERIQQKHFYQRIEIMQGIEQSQDGKLLKK